MPDPTREEQLREHAAEARRRLVRVAERLAGRQQIGGANYGNVGPWPRCDDADFHGTLSAIWVWTRAGQVTGDDRFAGNVAEAWSFAKSSWPRFIPDALGSSGSEEAPYDLAMVLRAALADVEAWDTQQRRSTVEVAARLLAAYLADLDDLSGREFRDPGFLAWNLAEYARAVDDRGLLAGARRFVDRAFGMKSPPPFVSESTTSDGLFDFSSTTATRVMAVLAAEGTTPFIGAWLRERVAPMAPDGFVPRSMDENTWNACVCAALGRSFSVATDPALFQSHVAILGELSRRADTGTLGRQPGFEEETAAAFYYALALDSVVRL